MDLLALFHSLVKAVQPTLFDLPEASTGAKRRGGKGRREAATPKPSEGRQAYQPGLFDGPPKPLQPSLLDFLAPKEPKEPKRAKEGKEAKAPRGRGHLMPVKRVVERGGKVFTQTYWVAPEETPRAQEASPPPEAPREEPAPAIRLAKDQPSPAGRLLRRALKRLGMDSLQEGTRQWQHRGEEYTLEVRPAPDGKGMVVHLSWGRGQDRLAFRVDPLGRAHLAEAVYHDGWRWTTDTSKVLKKEHEALLRDLAENLGAEGPRPLRIAQQPYHHDTASRRFAAWLRRVGIGELHEGLHRSWPLEDGQRVALEVHRVGDQLQAYLTHYREQEGDLVLDTELVFHVFDHGHGVMRLAEVAYTDPTGQERRVPASVQGKDVRGAHKLAQAVLKTLASVSLEGREKPVPKEAQAPSEEPKPEPQAPEVETPPTPAPERADLKPTRPKGFGFDLVRGAAARKRANQEALTLAQRLLQEGRSPTPEEAEVLARYTGEGGLTGDLNAHYTPTPLARSMWRLLTRALGAVPREVLEPSMGAGVFFHTAPEGVRMEGVELSQATATVAKALWEPLGHQVHHMAFEEYNNGPGADKTFDAVIANPPYGIRGIYAGKAKPWLKAAEEYFIDASLDRLRDGGVGVFLINPGPVENPTDRGFRLRLLARAQVLGVYQLPHSVFKDSGSGVPPVVLVVRKRPDVEGMTLLRLVQRHGEKALEAAGVLDQEFLDGVKHLRPETIIGEWEGKSTTFKGYKDVKGELTPELLERLERAPMEEPREVDHEGLRRTFGDDYESARMWAESTNADPERGRIAEGTISEDGRYIFRNHRWHLLQDEDPVLADAAALARTLQMYANAIANGARADAEVYRREALAQVKAFLEAHGEEGLSRVRAAAKTAHHLAHVLAAVEDGKPARHLEDPQLSEDELSGLASAEPEEIARALYARKRLETNLFARYVNLPPERAAQLLHEMGYAVDESGRWERRHLFYVGDPIGRAKALEAAAESPATPPYLKPHLLQEAEEFRKLAKPKRLGEFAVSPRDAYIPEEVVRAYARERYRGGRLLYRDPETGIWSLRHDNGEEVNPEDLRRYGYGDLLRFTRYLNHATPVERVTDKDLSPEERKALKQKYIEEARAWEKRVAEDFERWLAANPEHAEAVERAYNETYPPYIPEPDRDDPVEERLERWRGPRLHPYQRAAIAHALERGGGVIALDVGLGKTYTGLALAERLAQEGRARRVMVVAPRSLLGNWRNAYTELEGARFYASGEGEENLGEDEVAQDARKVLEALRGRMASWSELERATGLDRQRLAAALMRLRARDLARGVPPPDVMVIGESFDERRRVWVPDSAAEVARKLARLATDPSIRHVVISRDWFGRIPVRPETIQEVLERDAYYRRLEAEKEARAKKKGGDTERSLRAVMERFYQKQAEKLAGPKVRATYWEDLGVEALISDEHHAFKNLHSAPSGGTFGDEKPKFMGAGTESDRAMDMLVKTAHLRGKMGGGGVFAMTATPTKNSPLEVYNILRYVTDDITRIAPTPKAFVDRYIQLGSALVPSVTGGLKVAPAVVGWKNLNELRSVLRRFVFRRTAEEVGLAIPEREDHQRVFPLHPKQEEEMRALAQETLQAIGNRAEGGKIFSNMAKMRLLALDPALYSPWFAALPNPRYKAAAEIARKAMEEGGKVVMFMDLGTPSASAEGSAVVDAVDDMSDEEVAELAKELGVKGKGAHLREAVKEALEGREAATYERLRDELVAAGIPREQIAIVTSRTAASPAARADIEAAYRAGKIRVILGSTGIIGEGFNLQEDTTDVVHLDLPWDPGTYWQRLGRAVRQGNRQAKVRNHILMAQGSFDALTFATLKGKQGWTDILWNGHNDIAHNPETMDTDLSGYAQMVAAVAGDEEAARRFVEEQRAKARAAKEVAQKQASLKALREFSLAAAKWAAAQARRDRKGGEERYEKAAQALEEAKRSLLSHPDVPEEIKEVVRQGRYTDIAVGGRHVFVRGGAVLVGHKDRPGERVLYQIAMVNYPREGGLLLRALDGQTIAREMEDLEDPNYHVEPLVRLHDEALMEGALTALRRHGPRGLTGVHPERLNRLFRRDPQAFAQAYADWLRAGRHSEAAVITRDGQFRYLVHRRGDTGRKAQEYIQMLERGDAYPVLPIPEHREAVSRAQKELRFGYFDIPYEHVPLGYRPEEGWRFDHPMEEDALIKGEDLVSLWRRLVKGGAHVET